MNPTQIPFRQEILRKVIHLSAIMIPIGYALSNRADTLLFLIPITVFVAAADFLKSRVKELNELVTKIFGGMLRPKEYRGLSGASYTLLASCIVITLFPLHVAVTALAVPAVADTAAGLVGRKFGRMKFFNKTVEGTLAFILSGTFIVYVIMNIYGLSLLFFVTGFVAVCIAGVVEAASRFLHIDDNFSVPIVMGFYMGVLL